MSKIPEYTQIVAWLRAYSILDEVLHIIEEVSFCEEVESTVIPTSSTVSNTERRISSEDLNNLYVITSVKSKGSGTVASKAI